MTLRKKTIQAGFWSALEGWGTSVIGIVLVLVMARLLSPSDFGLIELAWVFLGILQVLADYGTKQAIIQRKTIRQVELSSVFWFKCLLGFIVLGIALLIARPASLLFGEPRLAGVMIALSGVVFMDQTVAVHHAMLRREFHFRFLALEKFTSLSTGSLVGIVMAFQGYGVWSLVAYRLVDRGLDVVFFWVLCPWRPDFRFSWTSIRDLLSFGGHVTGANLVHVLRERGVKFLLGYFLGLTELGYFSIARDVVVSITSMISNAMENLSLPTLAKLQSEPAKLRRVFHRGLRLMELVYVPVFFGLAITAPVAVPLVLGPKWDPSVVLIQIFALATVMYPFALIGKNLLYAVGRPRLNLLVALISNAVLLGGLYTVVDRGLLVVALVFSLAPFVSTYPLLFWFLRRELAFSARRLADDFAFPLLASTGMVGAILGAEVLVLGNNPAGQPDQLALHLALKILLGTAVYVGLLVALRREECRRILALLNNLLPVEELHPVPDPRDPKPAPAGHESANSSSPEIPTSGPDPVSAESAPPPDTSNGC